VWLFNHDDFFQVLRLRRSGKHQRAEGAPASMVRMDVDSNLIAFPPGRLAPDQTFQPPDRRRAGYRDLSMNHRWWLDAFLRGLPPR
jgi:hypothetical protein